MLLCKFGSRRWKLKGDKMNKHDQIKDNVITLNLINYQIAELSRIKEELEARVSALLEHGEDYSQTYTVDKYKVTVKSGWTYSLNKDEYECVGNLLPKRFNPVSIKQTYHLDKQTIRDAERFCSEKELELFHSMISKKPSKLSLKISAGI
jgi:hypothetical protein